MNKHFVTFESPGTFITESTTSPIDSWDVAEAVKMAAGITERYGAKPFRFQFSTRTRSESDLDSHISEESAMYYLPHCKIETLEEIKARNDPKDRILLSNMECNGWSRIITTTEGWKISQPFHDTDVILPR